MKECNQCGKCCTKYGNGRLSATTGEIELWDIFNPDIYRYVKDGKIWMDPKTGEQLAQCPWLRKVPDKNIYTCDIYYDRPDDCKHYPVTIEQMITDECEMLEEKDLSKVKQAQQKLDNLMADSRPPFE
ncbi:MAG: YkgJ family cysteine cluster protein [Proteobacteria bacterium]|nr:YkgJ family cysteine cluster protein [Pseudomonadota bacterium]NOG59294.1 YkgJ family cysteine cluster protein [Pseudomonadota bacterium]